MGKRHEAELNKALGKAFKSARIRACMSQKDIGELLGVKHTAVSRIERSGSYLPAWWLAKLDVSGFSIPSSAILAAGWKQLREEREGLR